MKDYLAYKDAELLLWISNFKNKILLYGLDYGLSEEEITDLIAQATALEQSIQSVATQKDVLAKFVAMKNAQRTTFLKNVRKASNRIKAHRHYREAIGQDLNIITPTATLDEKSYKPVVTIKIAGGMVRIKYQKKGVDGVNIYRRRRGEVTWQLVTRSTRSPYLDRIQLQQPGQPEHWEYRIIGVVKDVEIGQPSDIVEVVFGG